MNKKLVDLLLAVGVVALSSPTEGSLDFDVEEPESSNMICKSVSTNQETSHSNTPDGGCKRGIDFSCSN